MNRVLSPMKYVIAACLVLLCSCSKPVPSGSKPLANGAYRVEVERSSNKPASIVRDYVIETTSLRKVALEEPGGANSSSIAPDIMTKERTRKAQVTVEAELLETGEDAYITVKMTVKTMVKTTAKTSSWTARSEEVLPVPGVTDLSSVLTESKPTGDLTAATTLLRVEFENRYLQIVIE
jgi:hypothetical protein